MDVQMQNLLVFGIIFLIGVPLLQIFMSNFENKWLGLVLPGVSFFFSLLNTFGVALYTTTSNGQGTSTAVFLAIQVFLLYNISTVVLLCIHFGCRGKKRKKREMEKMNIQDLN